MDHKEETYFDTHSDDYAEQILATQPAFYENAALLLNANLHAGETVLDIGNGGLINYDYKRLEHLDCADIVVSERAVEKYKAEPNIRFFYADILKLDNVADESYDVVIIQAVIHHLAGKTWNETYARVSGAIEACARLLKPGGKIMIIESTVAPWFERMERALYPLMQLFFTACRFGGVYQFSPLALQKLLEKTKGVQLMGVKPIGVGPRIWIMGRGVPTRLTPCGATFYILEKTAKV